MIITLARKEETCLYSIVIIIDLKLFRKEDHVDHVYSSFGVHYREGILIWAIFRLFVQGNEMHYNCNRPAMINVMVIIYPQILQLKCGLAYRNKIQSAGFRDSCQFGRGAMNDWVSCPNVGHCLIWDNLGLEHLSLILKHANE